MPTTTAYSTTSGPNKTALCFIGKSRNVAALQRHHHHHLRLRLHILVLFTWHSAQLRVGRRCVGVQTTGHNMLYVHAYFMPASS